MTQNADIRCENSLTERNDSLEQENEKLHRFINAVNSVTDRQVQEIIDEAKQESENILASAHTAAEEAKKRHLNDNLKMTAGKYVRMVSKAELDMKKEVLICREELTRGLFDKVIGKINTFRQTEEYTQLLIKRLGEESELENARVCVSPEDMRLADKLKKAAGAGVTVSSDDTIKYGGFYILRSDKGTITDRTFDGVLNEQQSLFASKNLIEEVNGQEAAKA